MDKNGWRVKDVLVCLGIVAFTGLYLWGAVGNWTDYTKMTSPGNPASAYGRVYVNSSTNLLTCILSTGASCMPTSSGATGATGPTGSAGATGATGANGATGATGSGGSGGGTIYSGTQNPNGGNVDVAPHNMTSNTVPAPYVASSNTVFFSQQPFLAFDGSDTTTWSPNGTTGILELDLGSTNLQVVQNYSIQNVTPLQSGREPKNWTFQGSNDNTNWTTLDTQTNQTGWTAAQIRNYTVSSPAAYRYYRVNISANNGDGTIVLIAELYLFTASASPVTSGTTGDYYYQTDGTKHIYGPKTNPSTWPLYGTVQ